MGTEAIREQRKVDKICDIGLGIPLYLTHWVGGRCPKATRWSIRTTTSYDTAIFENRFPRMHSQIISRTLP
jgi:hypothetical protein